MFIILNLTILIIINSCFKIPKEKSISFEWNINTKFQIDGVSIHKGINNDLPLRVWYAKINLLSKKYKPRILYSNDKDKKEFPKKMMLKNRSKVLINGGFFLSNNNPMKHVGLLKTRGQLIEPASRSIIKDSLRYFINRGAFGIKENGSVDIAWCSTRNDSIFEWDFPLKNRPGMPSKKLDFKEGKYWDVKEALHAGPVLVKNGEIFVSVEQEVFFNSPVSGVQPRSAVGYTRDDFLILLVVDGRQANSRGVYLEELAVIMRDLGCVEALNLDGGGSSALLVDGNLINRPFGFKSSREIMSAISINDNLNHEKN